MEKAELPSGKTVLDISMPELKVEDKILAENVELRVRGPEKVYELTKDGMVLREGYCIEC